MEVDLAWIDIVAEEWCDLDDQNNGDLLAGAIDARDNLFTAGALVRLVKGEGWDDSAFFHRLNPDGTYLDGDIPENSVNELLVRSGFWMPTVSEHPWGGRLYSYQEDLSNPVWAYSNPDQELSELLEKYRSRLNKAANDSHLDPNPALVYCLEEKSDQVAILLSEQQDKSEDDDRDRIIVPSTSDDDNWALDCEGDAYYDWPQLCDGGKRLLQETLGGKGPYGDWGSPGGGSSAGSGGSGGGSNCTWVDSYYRKDGTRVSGHWRCR
jgi:hypothetical protein